MSDTLIPGAGSARSILVDGEPVDRVPVSDRGLAYGDGLFETIRIIDAAPCLWTEHMGRMLTGCRRLGIEPPSTSVLEREVASLAAWCRDGVIKIVVTRGSGGRGYRPDPRVPPRRICMRFDSPDYPPEWSREGVVVRICRTQATHNPVLAGLKHLNRLDNVLARAEWADPEIAEGLMPGPGGELVGGTMTNLFIWDGRTLATPRIDGCGVRGTVRATVLGLAPKLGVPCVERSIRRADLEAAQGLFLTNALIGVWPVRRLESRQLDPGRLPSGLVTELRRAARHRTAGPMESVRQ